MVTLIIDLPELSEGDSGHVEAHNIIRRVLHDHESRLRDLDARVRRLEPQWNPELPNGGHRPLNPDAPPVPELPDQPPKRHNPELPEQPSYDQGRLREE